MKRLLLILALVASILIIPGVARADTDSKVECELAPYAICVTFTVGGIDPAYSCGPTSQTIKYQTRIRVTGNGPGIDPFVAVDQRYGRLVNSDVGAVHETYKAAEKWIFESFGWTNVATGYFWAGVSATFQSGQARVTLWDSGVGGTQAPTVEMKLSRKCGSWG